MITMADILSLRNKLDNHFDMLLDSVKACSDDEPDILVITEEGNKIFTQRLLLCLHSPMMASVLASIPSSVVSAVSLPVSSKSLLNLIKVFSTGVAVSEDTEELLDISFAAKIVGANCDNFRIGVRKKKVVTENKTKSKQTLSVDSLSIDTSAEDDIIQKDVENLELCENSKSDLTSNKLKNFEIRVVKLNVNGFKNLKKPESKMCECGKQFSSNGKLARHALVHHVSFECANCGKAFSRKDKLKEHFRNEHV